MDFLDISTVSLFSLLKLVYLSSCRGKIKKLRSQKRMRWLEN